MSRIMMNGEEISGIKSLLAEVTSRYASVDDPCFLKDATVIAHELPRRLRVFLNDFRQLEPPCGSCIISGYPVDEAKIGATPAHWKMRAEPSPTLEEEVLFVLFCSLLGDVIAWGSQQNGYIVHDVLPIKEDENEQISTGSQQPIWWHNEDAFHPYRGDYVSLMCLRNPDGVSTTTASVRCLQLEEAHLKVLFEPRFIIRPDESHAEKNGVAPEEARAALSDVRQSSYQHIRQLRLHPPKIPVLYGDPDAPYLRLDPYFMPPLDDDEAQAALNALIRQIDERISEVVLQPGDFLFVDNYVAVHGRKPFKAKYDGSDRWLKRVNTTRDLRKSRDSRISPAARLII